MSHTHNGRATVINTSGTCHPCQRPDRADSKPCVVQCRLSGTGNCLPYCVTGGSVRFWHRRCHPPLGIQGVTYPWAFRVSRTLGHSGWHLPLDIQGVTYPWIFGVGLLPPRTLGHSGWDHSCHVPLDIQGVTHPWTFRVSRTLGHSGWDHFPHVSLTFRVGLMLSRILGYSGWDHLCHVSLVILGGFTSVTYSL